jgi:hypothetical protein
VVVRPHLAIEGDWRLIEPDLLRVPDVRRNDLVEREIVWASFESHAIFLGLDGQLAAYGVLNVEYRRIQRVDCEPSHGCVSATADAAAAERNTGERKFYDATRQGEPGYTLQHGATITVVESPHKGRARSSLNNTMTAANSRCMLLWQCGGSSSILRMSPRR